MSSTTRCVALFNLYCPLSNWTNFGVYSCLEFKCVWNLLYPMILKSKGVHGLTVTGPNPWNSKVSHFSFNFPKSFRTWKGWKGFEGRGRWIPDILFKTLGVVDLGLVKSFMLDWISDQIRFCNCGSSEESFVGNAWLKPMSAKMLIRNFMVFILPRKPRDWRQGQTLRVRVLWWSRGKNVLHFSYQGWVTFP